MFFLFTYVLYSDGALVDSITMVLIAVVDTWLSIVLGHKMGIGGVTCATFIAYCLVVLILVVFVMVKDQGISYRPYVNPGYVKLLTPLGLPESCYLLALVILEAGVNALALKYYSVQGVAVAAVVINLFEIVVYMSEGISEYETVALNRALGENNREDLKYGMRVTFRAVYIESIVFSLLFLFITPLIVGIFDIDDPETAKLTILATRILALAPFALITARVTAVFHQYTERVVRSIAIWLSCLGAAPLLLGAVLGSISLTGLVLGIALGPVVLVSILWIRPLGYKKAAGIDLRRTTVIFDDEGKTHKDQITSA